MAANYSPAVATERKPLSASRPLATPLVLYVEPSGYCNLCCTFCPQSKGGMLKDVIPLETYRKILAGAKFPGKMKLVRYCGNGEPLINREFVDMIRLEKEAGIAEQNVLVTNGLLLTENVSAGLVKHLDTIRISVNGLSAADYLEKSQREVDYPAFLARLAHLYKIRNGCKVCVKIPDTLVSTPERRAQFFATFEHMCDEIYIETEVSLWPSIDGKETEYRWGGNSKPCVICPQIFKALQIMANGDVQGCCADWARVNILGKVPDQTLPEIWNGAKMRALRHRHVTFGKMFVNPCRDCHLNETCEVDRVGP